MITKRKRGFALIEVVTAIILLTSYIAFNTTLYYESFKNVREVQRNTIATNLLIKTAENVRAQHYEETIDFLDTYTTSSYTYNIAVDVDTATYNSFEYKIAKVTVTYGENSMTVNVLKYNPPIFVETT